MLEQEGNEGRGARIRAHLAIHTLQPTHTAHTYTIHIHSHDRNDDGIHWTKSRAQKRREGRGRERGVDLTVANVVYNCPCMDPLSIPSLHCLWLLSIEMHAASVCFPTTKNTRCALTNHPTSPGCVLCVRMLLLHAEGSGSWWTIIFNLLRSFTSLRLIRTQRKGSLPSTSCPVLPSSSPGNFEDEIEGRECSAVPLY